MDYSQRKLETGFGILVAICLILFTASVYGQPTVADTGSDKDLPILISDSNTGYIDNAIIGNMISLTFDAAFDNTRPDKAEFFYAKCGCYRAAGDPSAPGMGKPGVAEKSVDAYQLKLNVEYALKDNFSVFAAIPINSVDPEVADNNTGLGDVQAGLKYALHASHNHYLTALLRAYIPTGDARDGLGTDHWSLEPGLLYFGQASPRTTFAAELRYIISIDGSGSDGSGTGFEKNFDSDVLRYGLGVSYDLNPGAKIKVTPVVEVVGWHIFDGLATKPNPRPTGKTESSANENIVNLKLGARIRFREKDSVYLGYGHALTQDKWYDDMVRIEYRYSF